MDQIYRKEKYQQYLRRLRQLKEDQDEGAQLSEIRNGINDVLADLRNKDDIQRNNLLYTVLFIPLVIVLIWLNVVNGYIGWPFVPLVLLTAFFVVAHLLMKNAISVNTHLKWQGALSEHDETSFLLYKLKYLGTALKVKLTRFQLIRTFYWIFFPLLLVFSFHLVRSQVAFGSLGFDLLVAVVLSTPVWWYFFKDEAAEYLKTREVIDQYQSTLQVISSGRS